MATRKPLVLVDGGLQQLAASDTLQVGYPVSEADAATKAYVDNASSNVVAGAGLAKNGDTLSVDPATALATDAAHGFMSSTAVSKLDTIAYEADHTGAALAGASSPISVNNQRMTNLGTPTAASDAATKAYVDGASSNVVAGNGLQKVGDTLSVKPADGSIVTSASGAAVGVLASDAQHGSRGGGSQHALASGSANGFMSSTHYNRCEKIDNDGAAVTFGTVTATAYLQTPSAPAYAASLNLDCSTKNDFAVGVLTGNLAITFTNPASGRQGCVWVKQDATGGRTVSFAASGYTVLREITQTDTNPNAAANAVTMYTYQMLALGGTSYLVITKTYLA